MQHSPSSNSPFRYVQLREIIPETEPLVDTLDDDDDDDDAVPEAGPSRAPAFSRYPPVLTPSSPLQLPRHEIYYPPARPRPPPVRPRIRIPDRLKPWLGIGSWAVTTIAFLLTIAFWKKQVFTGLDRLSLHLQSLGTLGYAILFCLIFITTIPPFPLYSTLIILSGYTFGVWAGAVISYAAALSGAVVVFLLSRHYLRDGMSRLLSHTTSLKRVVRAIEKRPRLLLLIRVAPYPYNLMNVLLASSHTLSFATYFTCTALSLVKVIIHTSVGSSIHSFAGYHTGEGEGEGEGRGEGAGKAVHREETENSLGKLWTVTGIILCIAILVYLSCVARKAVDDELQDEGVARAEQGEAATGLAEMREAGS